MPNKLSREKREQIIQLLVEGVSMRSISRAVKCSINTVTKLLIDAGRACAIYHDEHMREIEADYIQCDEIWAYCYAKQKTVDNAEWYREGAGDVWTWTAFERETKLIISYEVGDRNFDTAYRFIKDLKARLSNDPVQVTTDGLPAYMEAIENVFEDGEIDFAQLVKVFDDKNNEADAKKHPRMGVPDEDYISTSHVERQNLNMRMGMRRFTRLTNAFSKKLENHIYMLHLYFLYYNFVRIHQTLETTPAVAAGLDEHERDIHWILDLVDAREPKPNRPKKYKKKIYAHS